MSDAVKTMFAAIAPRYDRANTVLSMGVHHFWRREAMRLLRPKRGERFLDVCCGTGDMALALRDAVGRHGWVTGIDFCEPMLDRARRKSAERGFDGDSLSFRLGDAQALPVADASYDGATIAFGIRNLDDPVAGLRELQRALRPGGRLLVLEFGQPTAPVLSPLFRWYSRTVMPKVGALVTGHRDPYEYLPRTAAAFASGAAFAALLEEAGFAAIRSHTLSLGIAMAYQAQAPWA